MRRGFSLVELLVVIGIIAVLVGILIPTLGRVQKQANLLKCAAQMQQIGAATLAYAAENRGWLPTRFNPAVNYEYTHTYRVWDTGPNPNVPYGLGLLFAGKHLGNGKILYCPEVREGGWTSDGYTWPFMSEQSQNYYTSYMYQPHHTDPTVTPVDVQFKKLDQMRKPLPANAGPTSFQGLPPVLAIENIQNIRWTAHVDPSNRGAPAFNTLFPDGHVASVRSKAVRDQLNGFYPGGLASGWTRFDRVLKALLTDARSQ